MSGFMSPDFLAYAVHYGLLKGTASPEDAFMVYGKLLHNETLRQKRLEIKGQQHIASLVDGISALSPAELVFVKESVSEVVPFKK